MGIERFHRVADVHHNIATWEHDSGTNGIVHRMGAVWTGADETVLISGPDGHRESGLVMPRHH